MDITYHLTGNLKRLRMPAVIENLETRLEEANVEGNVKSHLKTL